MPHSSGGGSHGGGSHGGHGGHGGSSARTRTSSRPFHHSRRYVYYRNNQPRYFYAGSDFKPGFSISQILVLIPFIIMGIYMLVQAIPHVPKYSDHSIVIKDEINVISDEKGVMSELKAFQKKTGITPAVITISNEEWMNGYYSLENYAYDRYLEEFDDEMHWLIVYSQPEANTGKREYWYWEGMQGDNTDSVLTQSDVSSFNSSFTFYLDDEMKSFDDALKKSLGYLTENISMKPDLADLVKPVFIFIIIGISLFTTIYRSVKYRNATLAPLDGSEEIFGGTGNTYGGSNTYGSSNASVPYSANNTKSKPLDPQTLRRQRIINSGKNYTSSDYRADKKERDAEFNSFIDQYKQLMPENSKDESNMMPSLDSFPTTSATYDNNADSSRNLVTCQYCGSTFAAKYNKCPFCNARQ